MTENRVNLVIQGRSVDRRPFIPLLNILGARLTHVSLEQYYRDPVLFAAGQKEILNRYEPDALYTPLFFSGEGEAWGSSLRFTSNAAPNVKTPAAQTSEEFLALIAPDIRSDPLIQYFRKATRLTRQMAGSDLPIGGIALNPVDLPAVIMGLEPWIDTLLFHEEILHQVFKKTTAHFLSFSNALLDEGASFIVASGGVINSLILPRYMIEKIVIPVFKEAFSKISGPVIIHDGGGSITPYLDLYRSLPQVIGFVVNEMDDLNEARMRAGEDMLLICGLDGPTIIRSSPEEIRAKTIGILKNRSEDQKVAIGTTGPDLNFSTPDEQIFSLKQAVGDFVP